MTVKIGEPCRSIYRRPGGNQPGDRIVCCELGAGHPGDHEEVFTGSTWPQAGIDRHRPLGPADDWKTTLKVPDAPKMLRETLCAAQSMMDQAPEVAGRRREYVGRLQRLIDECDRHRPLDSDGKHGDRHTPTCGCDRGPEVFEAAAEYADQQLHQTATYQTGLFAGLNVASPLQPVHDAVTEVIENHPSGATDDYGVAVENARVWRAVDAALGALGIKR